MIEDPHIYNFLDKYVDAKIKRLERITAKIKNIDKKKN